MKRMQPVVIAILFAALAIQTIATHRFKRAADRWKEIAGQFEKGMNDARASYANAIASAENWRNGYLKLLNSQEEQLQKLKEIIESAK